MTDFSKFVEYECRHPYCQENCINWVHSEPAQTKQCWSCYSSHDLDSLASLTHHLPEFARGTSQQQTPSLD